MNDHHRLVAIHIAAEIDPELRAEVVEKGTWYPDPPPMLLGEDADQYTNRVIGARGRELVPYDHIRNRQCSINFHDECSEKSLPKEDRHCQCPCHLHPE